MIEPNLACAEAYFWENFEQRGDLGASLSIWHKGVEVLSLGGGFIDREKRQPWSATTPVLVWSATKGPAVASLLHALERQGESLDLPVIALWPEFGAKGKERLTIGDLLAHRGGLAALDAAVSVLDREAVEAALEAQEPNWPLLPSSTLEGGHGYHPRTFGSLLDGLMWRLEGCSVGEYWAKWFATPLGLDFWIGVPEEKLSQVAPVYAAKAGARELSAEDAPFYQVLAQQPGSLTARAFSSPGGVVGVAKMNTPEVRAACLPGFGGVGTAAALARFYALLAEGGALDGVRFFSSTRAMEEVRSRGEDKVLLRQTAFSAGFMHDPLDERGRKVRQLFGPSHRAFGQPGAGGSHAFADPENRLSFAYVMNQMETSVLPTEKALGIVEALYSA